MFEPATTTHRSLIYLVLPLIIWFAYFLAIYAVIALTCAFGIQAQDAGLNIVRSLAGLLTLATLAALVAIGLRSFGRWRSARFAMDGWDASEAPDADRARFIGLATLLMSLLALVATIWVGLPLLIVPPCG